MNINRKYIFILSLIFISSCTQTIDIENLKSQLREELISENGLSEETKNTDSKESADLNEPVETITPVASPTPIPTPEPTPEPTPTPFVLPEKTQLSAESIVDSMATIQSKLTVGMTKVDYVAEVASIKAVFDKFMRSEFSERHPSYGAINEAMKHYEFGVTVWDCYYGDLNKSFRGNVDNVLGYFECYGEELERDYGVTDIGQVSTGKFMVLNVGLSAVWNKASFYVKNAIENQNASPLSTSENIINETSQSNSNTISSIKISGKVVGRQGGKFAGGPLEGARVIVKSNDPDKPFNFAVETNKSGEYIIENVPMNANISIFASKSEGAFQTCFILQSKELVTNNTSISVDFSLSATYCP